MFRNVVECTYPTPGDLLQTVVSSSTAAMYISQFKVPRRGSVSFVDPAARRMLNLAVGKYDHILYRGELDPTYLREHDFANAVLQMSFEQTLGEIPPGMLEEAAGVDVEVTYWHIVLLDMTKKWRGSYLFVIRPRGFKAVESAHLFRAVV